MVADGIGGRTVDELAANMTDVEFVRWKAWYREPRGENRFDWLIAQAIATYVNGNRKKGSTAKPVSDFLLQFEEPLTKEEKAERLKAKMISFAGRHNGDTDE